MKELLSGFQSATAELVFFLALQGIFSLAAAVLILFYPALLFALVSFVFVCYAVLSFYVGWRVASIRRRVKKLTSL